MAAGPEMIPDIGSIKRSAIKRGYHYTSYTLTNKFMSLKLIRYRGTQRIIINKKMFHL